VSVSSRSVLMGLRDSIDISLVMEKGTGTAETSETIEMIEMIFWVSIVLGEFV